MESWNVRREVKVRYAIELDPATHKVRRSQEWPRVVGVDSVYITYRRVDGGRWDRQVALFSRGRMTVESDLSDVPGWLEDLLRTADGMERS